MVVQIRIRSVAQWQEKTNQKQVERMFQPMGTWESTHMIASISICITNAKTARRRSQYTVMPSYVRQYPWVRSMGLLRIPLDTHLIPSSTSFHLQYSTRFS